MNKNIKKWGAIVLIVFLSFVSLSILKNEILRLGIQAGAKVVTGLDLKIEKLNLNLIHSSFRIHNLKLLNPKSYPDRTMMSLPEIEVDYDFPSAMRGIIHLRKLKIYLSEFHVVRNKSGVVNLSQLTAIQSSQSETHKSQKKTEAKQVAPKFQIDVFELTIDKVFYHDYSKGDEPKAKEFHINLNEEYRNISSPQKLVILIVTKALWATTIGNLAEIDLVGLSGKVSDLSATSRKIAVDLGEKTSGFLKSLKRITADEKN